MKRGAPWNLRLKITLWFLAIYGVLQISLLGAVVLYRQDAIRRSFDEEMRHWAEVMARNATGQELPSTPDELRALVPKNSEFLIASIRDRRGGLLVSTAGEADVVPMPSGRASSGRRLQTTFDTLQDLAKEHAGQTSGPYRVITHPVQDELGGHYYFQAVRPALFFERALGMFKDLLLVGLPVGLVSACIAAWLIAGRAVRPLKRLAEAARHVAPESIEGRLEVDTTDFEVAKLQGELNNALERIETGYRAQESFIANVSHELKTPIAVLLAEAQTLDREDAPIEEHARFRTSVETEMRRLGKLVESFLTLTRTDLGHELLKSRRIPFHDIVLDSLQHCQVFASRHDVRLLPRFAESERELVVQGDADLLRTMIDNLILNAVRFSPPDGAVEVRSAERGRGVVVEVLDEGPGVPAEDLERIFERFAQVNGASARSKGTGLGLAIAKGVAEIHGGRIRARNRARGGCIFSIELPLAHDSGPGRRRARGGRTRRRPE